MGIKLGGGGGSPYTVEQNSDINVTPFVDIMLVLLIIFMVTIPAATTSIKLDMPRAEGGEVTKPPVFVSVMGPDDLYIGSHKTSLASLDADLRGAMHSATPLSERVLIRADKDVDYGAFVTVLNRLKADGYTRIALINEDLK
ncbi:biopolymer transporter ExbD [Asticcacaulis solisilvae]|uniref:biopolymer transporter ExbD n=1 Tax=Asticcacaulis solisilvae TaxID=1217274 RepID=UPI003FD79F55